MRIGQYVDNSRDILCHRGQNWLFVEITENLGREKRLRHTGEGGFPSASLKEIESVK
jgi:hypothetical protein